jgi:hypothetical protein
LPHPLHPKPWKYWKIICFLGGYVLPLSARGSGVPDMTDRP